MVFLIFLEYEVLDQAYKHLRLLLLHFSLRNDRGSNWHFGFFGYLALWLLKIYLEIFSPSQMNVKKSCCLLPVNCGEFLHSSAFSPDCVRLEGNQNYYVH